MFIQLTLVFVLLFSFAVKAQTPVGSSRPDFSGTWNARITRSADGPLKRLTISYNDPKLEISRTLIDPTLARPLSAKPLSLVYYTDGRGETQKPTVPTMSNDPAKSRTQRIGEKFVITTRNPAKGSGKNVTADDTVTFEVSSDGKILTETITFVSDGNTRRFVYLYDRIAGSNTRDINGEWLQRISNQLISLTIEHHDPEIKVTRRVVSEAQDETETYLYYTDGRGEVNVKKGRSMKSATKWKGQNLIISLSYKSNEGGNHFELKESINWEISSDANSLIEVTQSQTAMSGGFITQQPKPIKLIYARSSK